jgi:hypothetical protein
MSLTDEQIVTIRDDHLPNQGERLDCIAFARAVIRADHCVSDEAGLDAAYADGRKDEREDAERDAARYRWFRAWWFDAEGVAPPEGMISAETPDALDAAIDAAIDAIEKFADAVLEVAARVAESPDGDYGALEIARAIRANENAGAHLRRSDQINKRPK